MHPITSYQIATLQASELRRRTDLRSEHAPVRRRTGRHALRSSAWPSSAQVRAVLTALRAA